MFTREQVEKAVLEAVAETYNKDISELSMATDYKDDLDAKSVKIMKTIMFIDENLDTDEVIEFEEIITTPKIGDTVDFILKKHAL